MFYFTRKIVFNEQIGSEYFENPTKFLELKFSVEDQETLYNYLTASQRLRYKILTSFEDDELVPFKFFTDPAKPLKGYVCLGVKDVYDFIDKIYYSDEQGIMEEHLSRCAKVMNWSISELQIYDSELLSLTFKDVENFWLEGYSIVPIMPK